MSRLRRSSADDDGFSLVEILVAITIFGIVATAVLPVLLAGIRGGTHAKLTTQAKNIAQERLELMRNLPYYVAQQNGDYRDVLDIYFRDVQAVGVVTADDPCVARGYVAATTSYRCDLGGSVIGQATFSQVVETTFLNAQGAVVAPRSTYDSQAVNLDAPASSLLSVVITTTWTQGAESRDFVLRSRIVNSATDVPLITSKIKVSAVKVTSTTDTGDVLQFESGLLSGDGSKSTASSSAGSAVGAYASKSSGVTATGAEVTLSAPPDDIVLTAPTAGVRTLGTDCTLVCFGDSAIGGAPAAKVSAGVPQLGVHNGTTYLASQLSRTTGFGARGFEYNNSTLTSAVTALGVSELPLVSAGTGNAGPIAESRGSLTAVSTGTTSVTATVQSSAQTVQLFPTSTASGGLVQLRLTSASLTCVDGAGRGVAASWSAEVRVHVGLAADTADGNQDGYSTYLVEPGGTALPAPLSIMTSTGSTLDRYISSWSGLVGSAASVAQTSTPGVSGTIPAVVSLLTAPTRIGDAGSTLNITLGSLSCAAEDNQ